MYLTILDVEEEEADRIEKICKEIEKKDRTFSHIRFKDRIEIYSNSYDQSHKRGMWFFHKFGVLYRVKKLEMA
jgi:hypothetical protein